MRKKGLLGLGVCVVAGCGLSSASSSLDAFKWGFEQGIIETNNSLVSSSNVQRQQFAPILLNYIDKIAHKEYSARTCHARDISNIDTSYSSAMQKLCSYGILNGEDGSLYPLWKLTNGQAVALIMRIIDGVQDESTIGGRHWAQGYFDRARQLGYWVGDMDAVKNIPISYEELVSFLYATRHPNQMISLSVVESAVNQSSMSFNSSDDALRRLAEIMAS